MTEEQQNAIKAIRAIQAWMGAAGDDVPSRAYDRIHDSAQSCIEMAADANGIWEAMCEVMDNDPDFAFDDSSDEYWNAVTARIG